MIEKDKYIFTIGFEYYATRCRHFWVRYNISNDVINRQFRPNNDYWDYKECAKCYE